MKKGLSVTLTVIGALGCAFLTYPIGKRWYNGGYEVAEVSVSDLLKDPPSYKNRYVRVTDGKVNLAGRVERKIDESTERRIDQIYFRMVGDDPLSGAVAVVFSRHEAVDALPMGEPALEYRPLIVPAVVSVGTRSEKTGGALTKLGLSPDSAVILYFGTKPAGVLSRMMLCGVPVGLLLWGIWGAPPARGREG
jgi:hypothetical protein